MAEAFSSLSRSLSIVMTPQLLRADGFRSHGTIVGSVETW